MAPFPPSNLYSDRYPDQRIHRVSILLEYAQNDCGPKIRGRS